MQRISKRSDGANEENNKHRLLFSDSSVFSVAPFLRSGASVAFLPRLLSRSARNIMDVRLAGASICRW
jgi:hypothetical protein